MIEQVGEYTGRDVPLVLRRAKRGIVRITHPDIPASMGFLLRRIGSHVCRVAYRVKGNTWRVVALELGTQCHIESEEPDGNEQ